MLIKATKHPKKKRESQSLTSLQLRFSRSKTAIDFFLINNAKKTKKTY
jgi:hypothetical protein